MSGRGSEPSAPGPQPGRVESSADEIRRDAGDLRKGVAINLVGYAIKLAYPLLSWVAVYFYGSRNYGFFVAGQATIMIAFRVSVLGLDKGMWWWVPRQPAGQSFAGLGSVLVWVTGLSALSTAACFAAAPLLADWGNEPEAISGLRWLALSIVPMALLEVLVGAALGKRKMAAQVLIKDGFVPTATVALALLLYAAGMRVNGLPLGFVLARTCGVLAAAAFLWRKTDVALADLRPGGMPAPLLRYSLPLWLSELGNAFMQRMDILVLSALTRPEVVGAYGVVLLVGNTLKSIRAAFDPIMIVILSEISALDDRERMTRSFSHASWLVLATQIPVYVVLLLFSQQVLPLLGAGYEQTADGVLIVASFSLVFTFSGMHGHVIRAYGRTDWVLLSVVFTASLQGLLLYLLIPGYGMIGATLAVGLAYLPQNVALMVASRSLAGSFLYDRRIWELLALAAVSSAVALLAWLLVTPLGDAYGRVAAACSFAAVYAWGIRRELRKVRLPAINRVISV